MPANAGAVCDFSVTMVSTLRSPFRRFTASAGRKPKLPTAFQSVVAGCCPTIVKDEDVPEIHWVFWSK
jgi:hypothetical protein